MLTTLISQENSDAFLKVIPKDIVSNSDVFFGAVTDDDVSCGVIAGKALGTDTLSITFLYVAPPFRNKGAGRMLIDSLISFAEMSEIDTVICSHQALVDTKEDSLSLFLLNCGFNTLEYTRQNTYSFDIGSLNIKRIKSTGHLISLKEASKNLFKSYADRIKDLEKKDESGTVIALGDQSKYDQNCSFFYLDNKKNPVGAILFVREEDGLYMEDYKAFGEKTPEIMYSLLLKAQDTIPACYPSDCKIYFSTDSEAFLETIQKATHGAATLVWTNVTDAYFL